jgi:hypothetical protein
MRFKNKYLRLVAVGVLLAALPAVSGCREEEQGRILHYQKGTYLGKPDQKLSAAQEQELRARARNQMF